MKSNASLSSAPSWRISTREARAHSAKVDLLRLMLPVCAVAMASAFIFTAKTQTVDETFLAQFNNLDAPTNSLRMDNPRFVGDAGSQDYQISAKSALQSTSNPAEISLEAPGGITAGSTQKQLEVTADSGIFNQDANVVDLDTNVELTRGIGGESFVIYTDAATVELKDRTIESKAVVYGVGAAGELTADSVKAYADGRSVFINPKMRLNAEEVRETKAAEIDAQNRSQPKEQAIPRD